MLSGDNGILQRATDAKEMTDVAQEKEIVALAYNSALAKKVGNGDATAVTAGDLNTELTNQGATASGSNPITVTFTDSRRQYTINNSGTIEYAGIDTVTPTTLTLAPLEIPAGLTEGDTITWTPAGGTYTWDADYYASDSSYNDQLLATGDAYTNLEADVKSNYEDMTITSWKVLSVDSTNHIVKIVPAHSTHCYNAQTGKTSGRVYLQGAQGYNNGVKLLNDACSALYGDAEHGITARSINIGEDIEGIADEDALDTTQSYNDYGSYTFFASYGGATYRDLTTGAYIYNKSYPQIWTQEVGSYLNYVDSTSTSTGTLGLSSSPTQNGNTIFIDRTNQTAGNGVVGALDATNNIRAKATYYYADLSDLLDSKYSSIIGSNDYYWVASRYVGLGDKFAYFGVRAVDGGMLSSYGGVFDSKDATFNEGYGLFPVVTLSSGVLSQSGSGYTFSVE